MIIKLVKQQDLMSKVKNNDYEIQIKHTTDIKIDEIDLATYK